MHQALTLLKHPVGLGIIVIFVASASFRLGSSRVPAEVAAPDTVYADRQLLLRDTIHTVLPVTVTLFDTVRVTETRVDTIRVPVNFGYSGVVGSKPITRTGNKLTLTSFDIAHQRFTQQTYTLPERKWGFGIYAVSTLTNVSAGLSLEMDIRYKRIMVTPFGGVQSGGNGDLTLQYGVSSSYRLF